tara:strand:- start:96 stop:395 length:300 start_codon:yes stop_codon:yes gene_type:complete
MPRTNYKALNKKFSSGSRKKLSSRKPIKYSIQYRERGRTSDTVHPRAGLGAAVRKRGERLKDITGQEMFSGMKAAKKVGRKKTKITKKDKMGRRWTTTI